MNNSLSQSQSPGTQWLQIEQFNVLDVVCASVSAVRPDPSWFTAPAFMSASDW